MNIEGGITKEELAERLNGRMYGSELYPVDENLAKESGLVVLFGQSDDLIEFRGAIYDEQGASEFGEVHFTKKGKFIDEDKISEIRQIEEDWEVEINIKLNTIETIWDDLVKTDDGNIHCSWQYKTEIPHSTFDIFEDDDLYCRGIVFDINDLK